MPFATVLQGKEAVVPDLRGLYIHTGCASLPPKHTPCEMPSPIYLCLVFVYTVALSASLLSWSSVRSHHACRTISYLQSPLY